MIGAAGLAVILVARFIVIPWVDDWSETRRQIAARQQELSGLERNVTRVLGQRKRLTKKYGPAVNKPLEDVEAAWISLFTAARGLTDSGFEATDYLPQSDRPLQDIHGVRFVPLQVRGKCKLPQLAKLLAKIRQSETLVIVDRLTVSNDAKKPGQLEVTMVLATLAREKS